MNVLSWRSAAVLTVVVIVCLTFGTAEATPGNLTYECFPNNTLLVLNPRNYTTVFANNSKTVCRAVWTDASKRLARISDCVMDINILVFFSYLSQSSSHVIGGTVSDVYTVNCVNIPKNGVIHNVSVSAKIGFSIQNSTEYPSFLITSKMYADSFGTKEVNETLVGTGIYWILEPSISSYKIRPEECWAYAGKEINSVVAKKQLIMNGCVVDDTLMGNFVLFSGLKQRAHVYAFRFINSEYVTMWCSLRICKLRVSGDPPTFCSSMCSMMGKRDAEYDYAKLNDTYSEKVTSVLRVNFREWSTGQGVVPTWCFGLILAALVVSEGVKHSIDS